MRSLLSSQQVLFGTLVLNALNKEVVCFQQPSVYQRQHVQLQQQPKFRQAQQPQQWPVGRLAPSSSSSLLAYRDEDSYDEQLAYTDKSSPFTPETAFGSEIVPEGQRPINEYLDILRSPLFDWACLEDGSKGLATRLAVMYALVFGLICYPIAGATFTQEGYLLQKLTASNFGAIGLILALLVRLYSGWSYVGQRLTSKTIEYEETGWYDGNVEMKTKTEFNRDKFLYSTKVKPIVERVKTFLWGTLGLCVASFLAFQVAYANKPVFDEYNPELLERIRYDDKMAEKAAENSYGKPTYCDNRYYRAVAGSGQGCQ